MKNPAAKNSNMAAALAVSLLLHLAAFGVAAAVQPKAPSRLVREYIPVELVQLPAPLRGERTAPLPPRRAGAAPPPAAPTRVTSTIRQEPSLPPAAPQIAPLPSSNNNTAPTTGAMTLPRTTSMSGVGAARATAAESAASAKTPATGVPQPLKRGRGDYLAFHRLTRLPSFKSRIEPAYPDSERMTGGEARVLAEIYLDEHGRVDDIAIRKSGGRLFDQAVIEAARQSSFHPGFMGEKAVPTVIRIPYVFQLK